MAGLLVTVVRASFQFTIGCALIFIGIAAISRDHTGIGYIAIAAGLLTIMIPILEENDKP